MFDCNTLIAHVFHNECNTGVWIEDLTEEFVGDENDILDLLAIGDQARTISATRMNSVSSRGHSLFIISIEQKNPQDGSIKCVACQCIIFSGG